MEKVLHLYRFAYLYGITGQGQMQYVCERMSRAALYKELGSRLAAVVAVAQGLFPAGLFGGSMLFESTLAVPFARQIKQKLRYPLDTGVLGGRGWIARAAQKRDPGRGSQRLHRALGGTRILLAAAPTAPPCFCRWQRSLLLHRGFFTRRTVRRVDAVRIHPLYEFSLVTKQKPQRTCIR